MWVRIGSAYYNSRYVPIVMYLTYAEKQKILDSKPGENYFVNGPPSLDVKLAKKLVEETKTRISMEEFLDRGRPRRKRR